MPIGQLVAVLVAVGVVPPQMLEPEDDELDVDEVVDVVPALEIVVGV